MSYMESSTWNFWYHLPHAVWTATRERFAVTYQRHSPPKGDPILLQPTGQPPLRAAVPRVAKQGEGHGCACGHSGAELSEGRTQERGSSIWDLTSA